MARRIKFKLQDTTPPRIIYIEPDATHGATLGTDVFTPDGAVGTPATVRAWLNVTESQNPRERAPGNIGVTAHRLLQGLTLGDDHPQYTQWVQDEIVTGDWHFRTYEGILIENPDYLEAGIHLTTFSGPDPLNDGIGNQLAFWEVGVGGAFTSRSYGFRIRHTGDVNLEGNLDFYRHQNDVNGVAFLRFTRDSNQIQFIAGTAAAPIITTFNDLDTGIYFPAADEVGISTGGAVRLRLTSVDMRPLVRILGTDGTALQPAYSFANDDNIGMYRVSENVLGFATSGVVRFTIGNTTTNEIISTLVFRGPAGDATEPTFSFSGDTNTGMYSIGADQLGVTVGGTLRLTVNTTAFVATLPWRGQDGNSGAPAFSFSADTDNGMYRITTNSIGFATAGAERFRVGPLGQWGIGGANFGAAGEVLTSNGAGAAPSWQAGGGGSGTVDSIIPGHGIGVDDYADPANPIVFVDETDSFFWLGHHTFAGAYLAVETELRAFGTPGSAGEVLTSNGVGLPPSWEPAGGGSGIVQSIVEGHGIIVDDYPDPANPIVEIDGTALLDNNARVAVRKNTAAIVGTRRRLNLIEGANVTLTIADDAANEEVDVTIAASGGGGGASATTIEVDMGSTPVFQGKFTITDAAISATSKVLCWQHPGPYTGKGALLGADMEPVEVICVEPAAGSAVVKWQTPPIGGARQQAQQGRLNAAGATFDRLSNQRWPDTFDPVRIGRVRGNIKFSYVVFA